MSLENLESDKEVLRGLHQAAREKFLAAEEKANGALMAYYDGGETPEALEFLNAMNREAKAAQVEEDGLLEQLMGVGK